MKKQFSAILGLAALLGLLQLFTFSTDSTSVQNEAYISYFVKSPKINKDINFCGETVPLYSADIMERFDKEILKNSYWHSEMLLYYKRSGKFFPIIEPILKKHGIPNDFKYVAIVESGLSNVVSPAGAAGFWQFMRTTGKSYGLEVNKQIDERYNLEKATEAACKYFKESYAKFGSWTLVAASYNMGMGGLSKRLAQQKTKNYYDLLLNSETSRYCFRILAIKDILTNPQKYGFNIQKKEKYKPTTTKKHVVDTSISNWADYAHKLNINYKILKLFNPWIRTKNLNNKQGKKYTLRIPTEDYFVFDPPVKNAADSLAANSDTSIISPNLMDSTEVNTNEGK